jgi:hypothetical protein
MAQLDRFGYFPNKREYIEKIAKQPRLRHLRRYGAAMARSCAEGYHAQLLKKKFARHRKGRNCESASPGLEGSMRYCDIFKQATIGRRSSYTSC